jgi:virginiamycin B lyase
MNRVRSALAIASALGFFVAVPALADPTISSYPVTPAGTDPGSIVSGPSGELWFTERKADALGYSTTAGVVGQRTGLSSPGYDLAADSSGDLWVTEPAAGTIAELTPSGAVTNFSIQSAPGGAGLMPVDITAGPDGNMWFTADSGAGEPGVATAAGVKPAIGRITPGGTVTLFTHGFNPNGYPLAITAGPDGNLWFTEWAKNMIARITPSGTITEYPLPAGATQPDAIVAGPDGNLWFTTYGGPGSVGRITPSGTVTLFTAGLPPASQPTSITTGPDHNLWFTEAGGAGAVGTITPAGVITQRSTGTGASSVPTDITTGPDGNLWFTQGADPGSLGRVLLAATPAPPASTSAPTSTGPSTSATPPSSTSQPQVALPAIGRTAVASVLSGQVQVAGPSGKFVPLSASSDIQVGDVINTQAGVISITTRLKTRRHHSLYQTAKVWDGVFRLEQSRHRSLTTFKLVGAASCSSSRSSHLLGHSRTGSKKPSKQILWARDNGGQYTTRGQNSVATVRGTVWETIESCAGTTTFVKRGVVAVQNVHTGHTVLVHAGHRYLARR